MAHLLKRKRFDASSKSKREKNNMLKFLKIKIKLIQRINNGLMIFFKLKKTVSKNSKSTKRTSNMRKKIT